MPEFDFRLSNAEFDDVIDYVFKQGAYIVPDLDYEQTDTTLRYLRDKEAYEAYTKLEISSKLNIIRDDYFECELMFGSTIKNGKRIYYINDMYGGPTILLSWFTTVNQGNCSHYPYYFYEEVDYYKQYPPEALILFYKELFKYIRKKCVIVKYFWRRIYCGREYIAQVLDGTITNVEPDFKALLMDIDPKKLHSKKTD